MSAHMAIPHPPLLDRLPPLRGKVEVGTRLADLTWFRVGGPAEVLFRPEDTADLAAALRALPADVPVTVIGVGSNLLVRDGGIDGLVVKLGRGFATVEVQGDVIVAGAAASDVNVALNARDAGLAGLEFLRGVPGTIGGGVRMNAGAYGREFKDVLVKAEAVDRAGTVHTVTVDDLDLTYRHSGGLDLHPRLVARHAGRSRRDPGPHGRDQRRARRVAAGEEPHRRLHLRQSAAPTRMGTDRPCRLPRPGRRRCPGQRAALQFPDQSRQCQCRRP